MPIIGYCLPKFRPRPEQEGQQLRAQLTSLNIPLFAAEIPRLKAFDHAFHGGVHVGDVKGNPQCDPRMASLSSSRKGAGRFMAEASKYSKTLNALKQPLAQPHEQPAPAAPTRVKPRSKRSDPAWRPYTLMLKSETHTKAGIILKQMDTGQDLSDLAQELFEQWVKDHS